ncbi:hypothetical protein F4777DRAFT_592852 [Nemania sp. FL0916]|nr:hypothetical protein F4777DRAFT_592852 [Nemania sp. FL0916]
MSRTDSDGVLIISIDFGTTYTGAAYAYVRRDNEDTNEITPQPVTLWPTSHHGGAHSDSPKVPSHLDYTQSGITWGQQGFDVPGVRWFKLLLLNEDEVPVHLENSKHMKQARESLEKLGKDVVTVISDYLQKVWEHLLEIITRAWGRDFISTHPYHVVITVPAIWQDSQTDMMTRALRKAGVLNKRPRCEDTTYAFVSEPEAAALASLHSYNKLPNLQPGQTFVIADLGGGTVDIISFRVKRTRPKLDLEEIVEGQGGLYGATFLDEAFLECIERKLGEKRKTSRTLKLWHQMHHIERQRIMGTVWEQEIKRQYHDGLLGQNIDLGAQGHRRPELQLDPKDLNGVFDSVCKPIVALIQKQTEAIEKKTGDPPQFIVMNGGFGRCEYIYRKLCQHFGDRVEVLFEGNDNPWTAVARGAVLSGVADVQKTPQVHSRVSRYSYGWPRWEEFDHRIHDGRDHDIHELTGQSIALDQMEWIIHRGESIEGQQPRVHEYVRIFDMDEVGYVSFSESIYRSNLEDPPARLEDNESKENVRGHAEFQKHVIIDMKTPVPVEQLPKRGGTEFPHRILRYCVEVNIAGASLVLKATSDGVSIGEKVIYGFSGSSEK